MNITFVTASVSRKAGGVETGVRRLAQSLFNGATRIETYALQDEHTNADRLKWAPVPVRVFRVWGPLHFGFALGLSGAVEGSEAELIMSHGLWMYPSLATSRWHAKTGKPYIANPHGMLDPWALRHSRIKKRIAAIFFENSHLNNAACIRALCDSEARSIRAYGLKNPICVIPNGVDLPQENEAETSGATGQSSTIRCLKASGQRVLLYLGRVHAKKGLMNLLRAWHAVLKPRSSCYGLHPEEWVLAIAGWNQNGHENELKCMATELGLRWTDARVMASGAQERPDAFGDPQLVFLGPQFGDEKAACYRNCDAFILPSFSEGLPMAILEAWAYGKPVLMTPECNLPEGFRAGAAIPIHNGLSAGQGGPRIEEGLRNLFALGESALTTMGAHGRALVARRFDWPTIAAETMKVCTWVLGGGSKPSCIVDS